MKRLLTSLIGALAIAAVIAPASSGAIHKARWLKRVDISEYFPAPERWGEGVRRPAHGIDGRHRIDWLYSAWGMSMEGDGLGLDGKRYHIDSTGRQGWVQRNGHKTTASRGFPQGPPFWRAFGWRNRRGRVTFRLEDGGWAHHRGVRYIKPRGVSFAPGPSLPLHYWRSAAVDPRLIPLGSRIWVRAYRNRGNNGWMKAQDTGGAITRRHVDVYRRPPRHRGGGDYRSDRRIYVVPPGKPLPSFLPPPRH